MYKQRQTRQSIKYTNKTKYHNHNKTKYTQNTKQHCTVAYYNTCKVFFYTYYLKTLFKQLQNSCPFSKCSPSLLFLLAIIYSTLLILLSLYLKLRNKLGFISSLL